MEIEYEIHIGKVFDSDKGCSVPNQKIIISEQQFEIVKLFADVEKDNLLREEYIINKCRFKVVPHFKGFKSEEVQRVF